MSAEEEMELDELKEKIDKASEQAKAATATAEPSPEPVKEPVEEPEKNPAPASQSAQSEPEAKAKEEDDPVKWAKEKGFTTPEDLARALLHKEQEFHRRNQAGHPGYRDVGGQPPAPQPQWQPAPVVPQYQPQVPQYQPMPRVDPRQIAAYYPQLAPEDIEKVLPLVMDAAQAISARDRADMERRFGNIERTTQRNNEMMSLMQDPAFRDNKVQKEIHEILDSDPTIFQRERTPLVYAYEKAVMSLYRKQLQQGVSEEKSPRPPVTAGGGNGSANTTPWRPTEEEVSKWDVKDLERYMKSNGKVLPKR